MYIDEKEVMKYYILPMADYNYFNDHQQIIRVKHEDKLLDCYLVPTPYMPDPDIHYVLIVSDEHFLYNNVIDTDRAKYKPGIIDEHGNLGDIGFAFAFLINRNQKVSTTHTSSPNSGFSVTKIDMSDEQKVAMALTPHSDIDYTNTDKKDDPRYNSIGCFINKDGSILIKSKGASITMGEEGIHVGGQVFWDHTAHDKGIMQDNSMHDIIGSTIPTYVLSIKELPNFNKILSIADIGQKIINTTTKVQKVVDFVSRS